MENSLNAADIIKHYGMERHPEGGWFKRAYCSAGRIASAALPGFSGARPYCTAIFYLLPAGEKSALHRIRQDEIWHFYAGSPLCLASISPQGVCTETILGPDLAGGELFQYAVPGGHWFGARPVRDSGYSLAGCTVAPGFDFADFELGRAAELIALFPKLKDKISEFSAESR